MELTGHSQTDLLKFIILQSLFDLVRVTLLLAPLDLLDTAVLTLLPM